MLAGLVVIAILGYYILLHQSCSKDGGLVETEKAAEARWAQEDKFAKARKVRM